MRITGGQHAQLYPPGGRSFGWHMPQLVFEPEISVACRGLLVWHVFRSIPLRP